MHLRRNAGSSAEVLSMLLARDRKHRIRSQLLAVH